MIMGADAEKNNQESETTPNCIPNPTNPNPNSITQSQFLTWKLQKDAAASARKAEAARKRAEDVAEGVVQMNGHELFVHEPWVFHNTRY